MKVQYFKLVIKLYYKLYLVSRGVASSTMINGRHSRPPSEAIIILRWLVCFEMETKGLMEPIESKR